MIKYNIKKGNINIMHNCLTSQLQLKLHPLKNAYFYLRKYEINKCEEKQDPFKRLTKN